jgi:hypothetical protein
MPSETPEADGPTLGPQDLSQFFAALAEGLHAMAQPLTILRSSVPALATGDLDPAKRQRYGDMSVRQVQRVCALFDCLQDLVVTAHTPAECAPINLASLVANAAEDRRNALQAGVELRVQLPGNLPLALGDASRLHQALAAGFSAASLVAAAGDVIELSATARDRRVEVVLHIDRVNGIRMESQDLLTLRLAHANMVSQQGDYEFTGDPFRLLLALPAA